MITRLTKLGAAAIGFDVVFAEPDRLSPALAADVFRDLDEETRNKLRALPSNDQVMADAIRRSRVVLGETGLPTPAPQSGGTACSPGGVAALGGDAKPFCSTISRAFCATFRFSKMPPTGRGLFSIRTERDGMRTARPDGHAGAGRTSCLRCHSRCCGWPWGASTILIRVSER